MTNDELKELVKLVNWRQSGKSWIRNQLVDYINKIYDENKMKEKTNSFGGKIEQTDFFNLCDMAIKLNKEYRLKWSDCLSTMSSYSYLIERATVKINIGRQTGKTTYIVQNANDKSIVLTMTNDWIRILKERGIDENALLLNNTNPVYKLSGINISKYDTLYIDEHPWVGKAVIDDFIKELSIHWKDNIQEKTIIMFG